MALLSVKNLSLTIGQKRVLSDISFDVARGEIFGIIGESGSGKSMTALSVMGLLPRGSAATGRILLDGEDIVSAGEAALCKLRGNAMSMVFQEPMTALNPVQTIGRQVAETILVHTDASKREARIQAAQVLTRVGLPPETYSMALYPHELSGGQRQRVVIAMAIALKPDLLICDEPTTALDVTTQAQIIDLLKGLVAEEGMGLVFITHDLGLVAGLADRIAIMREGQIVEAGATRGVFRALAHPYTRQLFEASSHVPDRKEAVLDRPVLKVEDVVVSYPGKRSGLFAARKRVRAVDGVSFELRRGENLGLVGESGCGKSTLARAILGLDPIDAGRIAVHGAAITYEGGVARDIRRHMQVVFQDPYGSFNPRHTVGRLVAEPFHLLEARPSDARDRVAQVLKDVGLQAEDAQRYIHQFSGGQRQRIAIARALIIKPDLIILDEAVSALDVSIRAQILDLLADLSCRLDLSYLFISHDLSVVRSITDRVLVMRAGKILEEGATEDVFANPEHPYTRGLVEAAPDITAALAAD